MEQGLTRTVQLAVTMTRLISWRARLIPANGYSIPSVYLHRLNSNRRHYSKMPPLTHDCGIDAEPLYRYEPGGYHPVELGDILKDGRYKVLHKLGWSSFSTTWAAKDQEYVKSRPTNTVPNTVLGTIPTLQ